MNGSGVEDGNELGRRIYSRTQALQAQHHQGRGRLKRAFLPKKGRNSLSIDRLSIADMQLATEIAVANESNYPGPFEGWACVTVEVAKGKNRRVAVSPTDENPYHGDIVFPTTVLGDKGELNRHVRELTDAVAWREREAYPSESEIEH